MTKRKKPARGGKPSGGDASVASIEPESETLSPSTPPDALPPELSELIGDALDPSGASTNGGAHTESESALLAATASSTAAELETTVNVSGDMLPHFPGRDDLADERDAGSSAALDAHGRESESESESDDEVELEEEEVDSAVAQKRHLRGLLEALVFASDTPIKLSEIAKLAETPLPQVTEVLDELRKDYSTRGIRLEEVAGGLVFRTSPKYAPFIRDLTKQRPVRLTRAQVETLAIIAYRQPVTRPEVDDVRGVDSGPVVKLLLERDLIRILGKRDEVGRPLIYGTTTAFLEFFGLKSLKDLPTLREFTELTDESREDYEAEMGETAHDGATPAGGDDEAAAAPAPREPLAPPVDPRDLEDSDDDPVNEETNEVDAELAEEEALAGEPPFESEDDERADDDDADGDDADGDDADGDDADGDDADGDDADDGRAVDEDA